MSVHADNVFMAGRPETLKDIKYNIKDKFNISESGKVKKFLGVHYEWGHYTEKDVKKLVEG